MTQLLKDTATIDSTSFFLKREVPARVVTLKRELPEFEYLPTDTSKVFFQKSTASLTAQSIQTDGYYGIRMPFPPILTSTFFVVFLLCLVLFSIAVHQGKNALTSNLKNIFSFGVRDKSVYKEQITTSEVWGESFLIVQTVLLLSMVLFIYLWKAHIHEFPPENQYLIFGAIALVFLLFWGTKYLLYKFIGIFLIPSGLDEWIERYFRIIQLMGIVLFLPAMFFIYINQYVDIAVFILILLFLISRIIIWRSLLSIFVKYKIGFLYFIVYLCGLEIIPYFFLYGSIVFLIKTLGNIIL